MIRELLAGGAPRSPSPLVRRPSEQKRYASRLVVRFVGHLPYIKFASALLLPAELNIASAAAIAGSYAIFSTEIASWLTGRQSGPRPEFSSTLTPTIGSLFLLALMAVSAPAWAYALSPASFGTEHDSPFTLWPAFLALIVPICFCFAACQMQTRAQAYIARRLGLGKPASGK